MSVSSSVCGSSHGYKPILIITSALIVGAVLTVLSQTLFKGQGAGNGMLGAAAGLVALDIGYIIFHVEQRSRQKKGDREERIENEKREWEGCPYRDSGVIARQIIDFRNGFMRIENNPQKALEEARKHRPTFFGPDSVDGPGEVGFAEHYENLVAWLSQTPLYEKWGQALSDEIRKRVYEERSKLAVKPHTWREVVADRESWAQEMHGYVLRKGELFAGPWKEFIVGAINNAVLFNGESKVSPVLVENFVGRLAQKCGEIAFKAESLKSNTLAVSNTIVFIFIRKYLYENMREDEKDRVLDCFEQLMEAYNKRIALFKETNVLTTREEQSIAREEMDKLLPRNNVKS